MANQGNNKPQDVTEEIDYAISKSELFVENNKKSIIWGAVGSIVVVALCWAWNWYGNHQNAKAEAEIYPAQFAFESGDYNAALPLFEEVIDAYGSTKAGNLAKAYAGLCNKELGNFDEAIKQLDGFSGDDQMIAPAVESALGDCYVAAGQNDKAAKCFEKAAKMADNEAYSPIYLRKAGMAYQEAGNKDAALKVYNEIKTKWVGTPIGENIDKLIYSVK